MVERRQRRPTGWLVWLFGCVACAPWSAHAALAAPPLAAEADAGVRCQRPEVGSEIPEPADLHSEHGVLKVDLTIRSERVSDGTIRYCYIAADGSLAPTLRLKPGDLLDLHLKNEIIDYGTASAPAGHAHHHSAATPHEDPCTSGIMAITATNLHFHGTTLPSVCHQDEVLKTSIQPGEPAFQYKFHIPLDQPPGLYWYHPHIHGFSKLQVTGGASGALVIEGLERAYPEVAGLPERVLIIRDQDLLHPDASPARSEPVVPKMMIDRDGDAANNGTGFGKPARDLSINYVPVPYPDYPVATLRMRPGERQLWRVLNAASITYLNFALLFDKTPQQVEVMALDGVPLNHQGKDQHATRRLNHVGLAPGARAEIVVTGPPLGVQALLVNRTVDTGSAGENDPNRALARVTADPNAPAPRLSLEAAPSPLPKPALPWLGDVTPVRTRRLFFSEDGTDFFVTVDGETPTKFDPGSNVPNIVVTQGDVEDWIIENRSSELHAFHIHQIHFLLLDQSGQPVDEPFLRDTINVPYYNGRTATYPGVRLRMDFRDPNTVGTFPYHCHLLEHEDNGMMGLLRVRPAVHR